MCLKQKSSTERSERAKQFGWVGRANRPIFGLGGVCCSEENHVKSCFADHIEWIHRKRCSDLRVWSRRQNRSKFSWRADCNDWRVKHMIRSSSCRMFLPSGMLQLGWSFLPISVAQICRPSGHELHSFNPNDTSRYLRMCNASNSGNKNWIVYQFYVYSEMYVASDTCARVFVNVMCSTTDVLEQNCVLGFVRKSYVPL